MDFDRLPNEIFLQIFEHLPFKERVRIARVSRRFKFVSGMAISQTKSLNLTASIFRKAESKSMSTLFQLCAANQKQVIFQIPHASHGRYRSTILKRLSLFSDISHRRLQFIDLDTQNGTERDYHFVRDLLVNHPNLLSLKWSYPNGPLPDVVCEKIICLDLYLRSNDHSFLASMVDSCPKLKSLVLIWDPKDDLPRWKEILNALLAKTPELNMLMIKLLSPNTFNVENIWKLSSLHTLRFGLNFRISEQMLFKISTAFPLLEDLHFTAKKKMAADGAIGAFKNLKHLRQAVMYFKDIDTIDEYALQLAKCDRLQLINLIGAVLMSTTVVAFSDGCPQLKSLRLRSIRDIDSLETAIAFVKSLDGFVQKNLNIQLRSYAHFWQSDELQSTLAEINKTNGRQISIMFAGPICKPRISVGEECVGDQESLRIKPKKSLGRRLITAIRGLPRKMAKVFT